MGGCFYRSCRGEFSSATRILYSCEIDIIIKCDIQSLRNKMHIDIFLKYKIDKHDFYGKITKQFIILSIYRNTRIFKLNYTHYQITVVIFIT